jgi:hypothetical protein
MMPLRKWMIRLVAITCLCTVAYSAQSQNILWDQGPTQGTPYANAWSSDSSQNFAEKVQFTSETLVAGFTQYASTAGPSGDIFRVRFWADDGGRPGTVLQDFTAPVTSSRNIGTINYTFNGNWTTYALNIDFAPVILDANTLYWVGAYSLGGNTTTSSIVYSGALGDLTMFNVPEDSFTSDTRDYMFQLRGAVPAPSALATLLVGVVPGVGMLLRRHKA